MSVTSRESLDRLEHEVRQARATVSSELAQVRHRLEPEQIKRQAEETKDRLMNRARDTASQYIEDRKRRLKQTVLDAAMNNPGPTLAVGALVAWSLWGRLSRIPAPLLLIGAGGLAGLMRWNDGTGRLDQRTYPDAYGALRPEQFRSRGEGIGVRLSSMAEPASQAAGRARELAQEAGTRISEATARTGSAVSDMAGRTAEATARASSAVSDMAGHTAEVTARAGSAVSDMAGRTAVGISRAAGDAATTASDLGRQAQSTVFRSRREASVGARRPRAGARGRARILVAANRDRGSSGRGRQRQVKEASPRDGRRAGRTGAGGRWASL